VVGLIKINISKTFSMRIKVKRGLARGFRDLFLIHSHREENGRYEQRSGAAEHDDGAAGPLEHRHGAFLFVM
jgi:hypothetical protein